MFLAEKGIDIPSEDLDLMAAENRKPPYTDKNPGGQMPALELDDGQVIAETVAIFEYLEEKNPTPPLVGATAEERAETRMWQRRVELGITENIYNGFRYGAGLELFKDRMRCLPEAADGLKAKAQDGLKWLDNLMDGKDYIVGDRFTIVDIILFCCTDFSAGVGQTIDPALKNLTAWKARVEARPTAAASLHPGCAEIGMQG
jgi:glutathione S-transferase